MGFTCDACWFLLIETLLIKNNTKSEAALKQEAGGDEKYVFFFYLVLDEWLVIAKAKVRCIKLMLNFERKRDCQQSTQSERGGFSSKREPSPRILDPSD